MITSALRVRSMWEQEEKMGIKHWIEKSLEAWWQLFKRWIGAAERSFFLVWGPLVGYILTIVWHSRVKPSSRGCASQTHARTHTHTRSCRCPAWIFWEDIQQWLVQMCMSGLHAALYFSSLPSWVCACISHNSALTLRITLPICPSGTAEKVELQELHLWCFRRPNVCWMIKS